MRSRAIADLAVILCIAFDHRADVVGLASFRACISACPYVDVTMEVTGSYDLIIEGHAASLSDYSKQMDSIRPLLAKFVRRIDCNFVSKKVVRRTTQTGSFWVPCEDGSRRVDIGLIDKIVAEGDYMRLFIGEWNCLIHATISALQKQLDDRFIQIHRSTIVRIDFIDRLLHPGRRWVARLNDGSLLAIAKSHVSDVAKLIKAGSPKSGPTLPKDALSKGAFVQPDEKRVKARA